MKNILFDAVDRANKYIQNLSKRKVNPTPEALKRLNSLDIPLPDGPIDPNEILDELDKIGSPTTVASTGGRYFGFVVGGCLPAAMAANILACAWDQNAAFEILSPIAATLEEICSKWLISLFKLPTNTGVGFVTGATMANFSGLAVARDILLSRQGWDVKSKGLFDAPPITIIVSDEVHVSVLKSLSLLGLGKNRVLRVPTDSQGRMIPSLIPKISGPTILCVQAGNVNTGAFDPIYEISQTVKESGAWIHVDGAFGLWALASPKRSHLTKGIQNANSWATDAHKWLNVPYDSGIVFVRNPEHLREAMSAKASYLLESKKREPSHYVPEISRRARGIEIWAALRSLGKLGLINQIERCCKNASQFALGLHDAGYNVLNDVVLNQVLVSFGSNAITKRIINQVQESGICWMGSTKWHGYTAMRISVSSWMTSSDDVQKSLNTIIKIASEEVLK